MPAKDISYEYLLFFKEKNWRKKQKLCMLNYYLNMSFRAYIIGILNKSNLQVWLDDTTFSQYRMQSCQILIKLINALQNWNYKYTDFENPVS